MTLVAVWPFELRQIHAVADTRFSHERGVATEHGPKLLQLNVVCKKPAPSGFVTADHFRTQFGFAYCGSTLAALSAHALANVVCSNLAGIDTFHPPSFEAIAVAVGGVCLQYMRDVSQLSAGGGLFKAILFGFCPRMGTPLAFEMAPKLTPTQVDLVIAKHILTKDSVIVIGDQTELLRQRIEAIRKTAAHPIVHKDAPQRALQSLIDDGAIESVGGALQQAWATPGGLEIVATMRPIQPRPPSPRNAGLFVLGYDIMDMQPVDGYIVSMTGR